MAGERVLTSIALNQICESPFQPRKEFEESAIKALAESMEQLGQITPILVRPKRAEENDRSASAGPSYDLVCGERRLRAAKKLGWTEVRAIVEEMSDAEAAIRAVAENEARADINLMDKARSYQKLLGPPANLSQAQLAKRLGYADSTTVSRTLALLEQPEAIQTLLARGLLSERHARILSRISDLKRRVAMAKKSAAEKWSTEKLEQVLKRRAPRRGKGSKEPSKSKDIDGFRFTLQGDTIAIVSKFRLGHHDTRQFGSDLTGALDSFLAYDLQRLLGPSTDHGASGTSDPGSSPPEPPEDGAASDQVGSESSRNETADPAPPLAAPSEEEAAWIAEDWAAQLNKSLGLNALGDLARAFEKTGETESSSDLGPKK